MRALLLMPLLLLAVVAEGQEATSSSKDASFGRFGTAADAPGLLTLLEEGAWTSQERAAILRSAGRASGRWDRGSCRSAVASGAPAASFAATSGAPSAMRCRSPCRRAPTWRTRRSNGCAGCTAATPRLSSRARSKLT